jgi:flagellar biosynthesis/type III secretory pathway protein FliH
MIERKSIQNSLALAERFIGKRFEINSEILENWLLDKINQSKNLKILEIGISPDIYDLFKENSKELLYELSKNGFSVIPDESVVLGCILRSEFNESVHDFGIVSENLLTLLNGGIVEPT